MRKQFESLPHFLLIFVREGSEQIQANCQIIMGNVFIKI